MSPTVAPSSTARTSCSKQQAVDGEPLGVFLFDLDRFKQINDAMGHAVGDRVLQTFAQSATSTLGADALFGRIGGEEFACLMPVGDLGEAFAIGDRVRRNFADAALRFADGTLTPTVSVGVTIALDSKAGLDALLAAADRALYRAKANGRNRVEASAPLDEPREVIAAAPSIVPLVGSDRAGFEQRRQHSPAHCKLTTRNTVRFSKFVHCKDCILNRHQLLQVA